MPASTRIYHLAPLTELRRGLRDGAYEPARFSEDGFVHCSPDAVVVLAVARDVFAAVREPLVVLEVDPSLLRAETVYEAPAPLPSAGTSHVEGTALFPHVYGPLDEGAITGAAVLERAGSGFAWPEAFEPLGELLSRS